MRLQLNPKFLLLIYALGVGLAIGAVVLIFQVDGIVHVSLYNYGLQFSYEWATPYWTFLRLALGLLGCIACINVFSIVYIILSHQAPPRPKSAALPARPTLKTQFREVEKEKPIAKKEQASVKEENAVEIAALPMVCNKCGKVFTQPLCMFDFKSGKPRLVNVCPYCNAILAVSGNAKME